MFFRNFCPKMANRPLPNIQESTEELERLLKKSPSHEHKNKIIALLLVNECKSRKEIANRLHLHFNTIAKWFNIYQAEGLEGLIKGKTRGAPKGQRILPEAVFNALEQKLNTQEGFGSYSEIQQWLKDNYNIEIGYWSIWGLVRYHFKAKLKTARPIHPEKKSS